jgi:CDP-diacylglycerol---glycerol-3-phosphate 3-phosphatidyltransferase
MKRIPNALSLGRIFFSLSLFFIQPLSVSFYVIYILCGISDMLDGFIARKLDAMSDLGARLDSIADLVMIIVLLIVLYPMINPSGWILGWMILIGAVRFASMFVAKKKFKTFAFLHTFSNKLTGLALFLFPLFLLFIPKSCVLWSVCGLASLSAIEELGIQLSSQELNLDRKSIFISDH